MIEFLDSDGTDAATCRECGSIVVRKEVCSNCGARYQGTPAEWAHVAAGRLGRLGDERTESVITEAIEDGVAQALEAAAQRVLRATCPACKTPTCSLLRQLADEIRARKP